MTERNRRYFRRKASGETADCPAAKLPCSYQCFMRQVCKEHPDEVMALIERLDVQTDKAMNKQVRR